MSDIKNNDNIGGLIISEEVIASIAKNAVMDIEGVAGPASQPMRLGTVFRKNENQKFVKVHSTENDIIIDIFIDLKYGVKIPTVSETVQKSVKEAVQNMTGRVVTKVNVHIVDILLDNNGEEE